MFTDPSSAPTVDWNGYPTSRGIENGGLSIISASIRAPSQYLRVDTKIAFVRRESSASLQS
jgi:hypothetical protein